MAAQPVGPEHDQRRSGCTGKSGRVDRRRTPADQHGRERGTGGAATGAEDVGVGERIAQQHLHQHAGDREQPADGKRGQRARQAQLIDDAPVLHAERIAEPLCEQLRPEPVAARDQRQ